jgi:hypothetical protein
MSAPIRFNTFRGARSKIPTARDLSWRQVCAEIKKLAKRTSNDKKALPAFNFCDLAEPYNEDANVVSLTALPIDIDHGDALATYARAEELGVAALIYTSPSHPNEDESDRFRVIVPLTEPLPPEHAYHARFALAEMLGLEPGQGVEGAKAASQVFFVGLLEGSDERDVFEIAGEPVDTQALIGATLRYTWQRDVTAATVKALDPVRIEDPDERTAALIAALEPHWEEPGTATNRRDTLRALGGYLARRGWTDEQIAAVVHALPTARSDEEKLHDVLECARHTRATDGDVGAGWNGLVQWSPEAAAVIESIGRDPEEPTDWRGIWSPAWKALTLGFNAQATARRKARAHDPGASAFAPPENAPDVPLILRSKDGYVCLLWEGDERGHMPLAEKNLQLRCRELCYSGTLLETHVKGKPKTPDALITEYGASYVTTRYDFSRTCTTYDPAHGGSVTVGFAPPQIPPCFDADADAWLRALAGDHYDRLAVWIASCSQAHIGRLAACLIVIGPADLGKSMLGLALALLWNSKPPALGLVVERFNGALLRCPILADEEAQLFGSRSLNTKKFRDMIQATSRDVEPKGKERFELHGALRAVVSANEISDIRFSDLGGPDVVKALADRMLVLNAKPRKPLCTEALVRLRVTGSHLVDLQRIAAHLAWICATVEIPAERFIGAGGDSSEELILASQAEENVELWDTLLDWLDTGGGDNWSVRSLGLCVDPVSLAQTLEHVGKGWDQRRVRAALVPFKAGHVRVREGNFGRRRLWVIDAKRLALTLDAEAAADLAARLLEKPSRGFGMI